MRLAVDHTTRYRYRELLRHSTQYLRLTPRSNARQRVLEWRIETAGATVETRDGYGNILHVLTLDQPVREIEIRSVGMAEINADADGLDESENPLQPPLPPMLFLRPTERTRVDDALTAFARPFRSSASVPSLAALSDLAAAVLERMPFTPGATDVHSTAAEAFAEKSGVCQDHAHVFVACCRHLGVPARYISGYIHAPGFAHEHVASHAWAEAWVDDRWRSFDVTNGGGAGVHHLSVAIGADYMDACPVRGVRVGGGEEHMIATALVGGEQ